MSRVVVSALACVAFAACSDSKPPDPLVQGKQLFASQGCLACHMPGGMGSMMGPPLHGLAAHWTRDELARYFADPESFAERNERVRLLKAQFKAPMTPTKAGPAERLLIADYVLSL